MAIEFDVRLREPIDLAAVTARTTDILGRPVKLSSDLSTDPGARSKYDLRFQFDDDDVVGTYYEIDGAAGIESWISLSPGRREDHVICLAAATAAVIADSQGTNVVNEAGLLGATRRIEPKELLKAVKSRLYSETSP